MTGNEIRRILSRTLLISLLLISIVYLAYTTFMWPKKQSPEDKFFNGVAYDLNAPKICKKIGKKVGRWGEGFDPHVVWYTRSECYQNLAVKLKDRSLCKKVISISTLFYDGSFISRKTCLKDIADGISLPAPFDISSNFFIEIQKGENSFQQTNVISYFLKRLGYSQRISDWSRNRVSYDDDFGFYYRILLQSERNEFINKIESMPDQDN